MFMNMENETRKNYFYKLKIYFWKRGPPKMDTQENQGASEVFAYRRFITQ